jgi:hypothetical protein
MVCLLFENHPGFPGWGLGVFFPGTCDGNPKSSSGDRGLENWEEKIPGLWICQPFGDKDFDFSVKSWQVIS